MLLEYKVFGIGKIGTFKRSNLFNFSWILYAPTLWYLKGNINDYLSGNLRFRVVGVFSYSLSLTADISVSELATPVDLIRLCQVQSFIR